jgi:hypothetical protein
VATATAPTAFIFPCEFRIPDMIWMILVTQKDCAKEFVAQIRTLEKINDL